MIAICQELKLRMLFRARIILHGALSENSIGGPNTFVATICTHKKKLLLYRSPSKGGPRAVAPFALAINKHALAFFLN